MSKRCRQNGKQCRPWSEQSDLGLHCLPRLVCKKHRIIVVCLLHYFLHFHSRTKKSKWQLPCVSLVLKCSSFIRRQFGSSFSFSASSCYQATQEKQIRSLLDDNLGIIFHIFLKILCCRYSLESPWWGDSNESPQHTVLLSSCAHLTCSLIQPHCAIKLYKKRVKICCLNTSVTWPVKVIHKNQ